METKPKTQWDLSVLYLGFDDPKIEVDLQEAEVLAQKFHEDFYEDKEYLKDPVLLAAALARYFEAAFARGRSIPYRFCELSLVSGENTKQAMKTMSLVQARTSKVTNKIRFFMLSLKDISKEKQEVFLANEALKEYRYFLKTSFEDAKFLLTEKEENLCNLLRRASGGIVIEGVARALAGKEVEHKGEFLPISEASSKIRKLKDKERKILYAKILDQEKSLAEFAEAEINIMTARKQVLDDLRGYEKPYSATILGNEDDPNTIIGLAKLVKSMNSISHDFFKIKAKLLGKETLEYQDRSASIGEIDVQLTFNDAHNILLEEFAKLGAYYANTLQSYLEHQQIDAFPKKGKRGGAFCWGCPHAPTSIFLNHTDDVNSLLTFAHEMGHAFHGELSRSSQPLHYQGYTTSTAETASTFFEGYIFDCIFGKLSKQQQIIALHDQISSEINTVFRQVAAFWFEVELHEKTRESGHLEHAEIAAMLTRHMGDYLGPAFNLKTEDGYQFVSWLHFRTPFYVYTYAFGKLVSSGLFAMYKEDPKNFTKVEDFMKAGSSKSPHQIFLESGIDISEEIFFKAGLSEIADKVERLKKLIG